MAHADVRADDCTLSAYLVERYLSAAARDELADSVARVARLCRDSRSSGQGVEYVHSAFLPSEDTCFCLFRASSAAAVRAINRKAGFAFDRITEAELLFRDD